MTLSQNAGLFDDDEEPARPARRLVAHVDGGSRGNPGPAGYGAYLTTPAGERVAELNDFLGVQTNNFAEYSALVASLEYAIEHGYDELEVIADSELMVKQMKGQYKVRSEALLSIYHEAKSLTKKLSKFEIRHVLRHCNKQADRLANEAMDRGTGRGPAGRPSAFGSASATPLRADAYARPPIDPEQIKEVRGFVQDGVVHFTGDTFPDGVFVVIRRAH